jgi:molybdopterin converting factor small subunit
MELKLIFFAVTKEYFGKEMTAKAATLSELKQVLLEISPQSESVLNVCKFALGNKIIDAEYTFLENQEVFVLPPSSGG